MPTLIPLDPAAPDWPAHIAQLRRDLGAPHNPTLFPLHFLQSTLPKIGGAIVRVHQSDQLCGYGLLFPRIEADNGSAAQRATAFTLRYHALADAAPVDGDLLVERAGGLLRNQWGDDVRVVFYAAEGEHDFAATSERVAGIDMGQPSAAEATAARNMQRTVWGSDADALYPADLYSADFGAGTSLVARMGQNRPEEGHGSSEWAGEVAAFLLGFWRFGGSTLPPAWQINSAHDRRLESQIMGVLPAYRGHRLSYLLKRAQGEHALRRGVSLVNWTADPLQFANAALNFGLLRAVAFDFYPDYYPFRNELNRVPASRLGLTWLIASQRVRNLPLIGAHSRIVNLAAQPDVPRLNSGPMSLDGRVDAPELAIEIPADWTTLQRDEPEVASRWRATTDELFANYLGIEEGDYVITGVGRDGERRFLVAERVSESLWTGLAA